MSETSTTSSFAISLSWLEKLLKTHGHNFQLRDNVIERFEQEQIDEKTFMCLSEQDFIDFGVPFGPRKALCSIQTQQLGMEQQNKLKWLTKFYQDHFNSSTPPAELVQLFLKNDITEEQDLADATAEDLELLDKQSTLGMRKKIHRIKNILSPPPINPQASSTSTQPPVLTAASTNLYASHTASCTNTSGPSHQQQIAPIATSSTQNTTPSPTMSPECSTTLAASFRSSSPMTLVSPKENNEKKSGKRNDNDDDDDANDGSNTNATASATAPATIPSAAASSPPTVEELMREGKRLMLEKKEENLGPALEMFTRALELCPEDFGVCATLLCLRSECYLALGLPDLARQDAETCLEMDPESVQGRIRLQAAMMSTSPNHSSCAASAATSAGQCSSKNNLSRPPLEPAVRDFVTCSDFDALKKRLSADDARDVLLSVDSNGDNCLRFACYTQASVIVVQLLIDRSEELGILVDVLSSCDNKRPGCLVIGCVKNLHRQSLEVILNALAKVGLLKNALDVSKDPNPLHSACANNLNVDSLIALLNAYSAHLPLTPERAAVAVAYAVSNCAISQNAFHVLLRETARISAAAQQPHLFTSRFRHGQSFLYGLAKNNRADLLRIFIPFLDSFDQFKVSLTTPDHQNKLVTSIVASDAVRDLMTPESFFVLRKKYKLIYGRYPLDLKDPLENTNTKIPWLQKLWPDEPLDDETVNRIVELEIDDETVFGMEEKEIAQFSRRMQYILRSYIRLKNPSNSDAKADDFVNEQAQLTGDRTDGGSSMVAHQLDAPPPPPAPPRQHLASVHNPGAPAEDNASTCLTHSDRETFTSENY